MARDGLFVLLSKYFPFISCLLCSSPSLAFGLGNIRLDVYERREPRCESVLWGRPLSLFIVSGDFMLCSESVSLL